MLISPVVTILQTGTILFIKDEVTLLPVTRLSDLSRSHSEWMAIRAHSPVTVTKVFKDGHMGGIKPCQVRKPLRGKSDTCPVSFSG